MSGQSPPDRPRAPLAVWPVVAVIAAKSALNLAFGGRYGWHRDELYLAVAGHHPAGGYIDFPPLTPLLAAFSRVLFGDSLHVLRGLAVVAGALVALVAALVARDLGGGRLAQIVATAAVAFSPSLLVANGLFQPVSFDQLTTMALLWLTLRLLQRPTLRRWLAVGATVGIGLETKYTIAVPVVVLLAGLAVWRRDVLRPAHVATAAAVAVVLVVPNLVWQLEHGWASLHFFLHPPPSGSDESRPLYIGNLVLLTNPLLVPLAIAGGVHLWRDRRLRPLAATVAAVPVAYFVLGGKSYYALPVVLFALAAGAVPFERWAAGRTWRVAVPAVAAGVLLLALLPIGVPVLPAHTAVKHGVFDARGDYEDEIGWPGLVRQTRRAAVGQPVVVAENYGEAGALWLAGSGLPPVVSGHLSFRYWRPRSLPETHGLLIGFDRSDLRRLCSGYRIVDRIRMPYGVENEEAGLPIARCTFRGGSLDHVWPGLLTN